MEQNLNKTFTAVKHNEGATYSIAGGNYRIVISGKQTDGAYAIIEMLVPPMGGPGPHAHKDIRETFYVLDGDVEFRTEAGVYTAGKGTFVEIPTGGLVHGFKNKTNTLARLWCTVIPAGLDEFFAEVGKPVAPGVFLPPPVLGPDDLAKLKVLGEKYGQQFFPPNYLD